MKDFESTLGEMMLLLDLEEYEFVEDIDEHLANGCGAGCLGCGIGY